MTAVRLVFVWAMLVQSANTLRAQSPPSSSGESFSATASPFPALSSAAVAWGDYDYDGRMDLLLAGVEEDIPEPAAVCQVWRNTESGFINATNLPGFYACSLVWADFDNDDRLDVLMSGLGADGRSACEVWRNSTNGFERYSRLRFIRNNFEYGAAGRAAAADIDNDGLIDIILVGRFIEIALFQVWRNTGNGFTNVTDTLPNFYTGSLACGDLNSDGWLDVALQGIDQSNNYIPSVQAWTNGLGTFKLAQTLTNSWGGPSALVDYNADGQEDFAFAGSAGSPVEDLVPSSQIWFNAANAFTNSGVPLPAFVAGSFDWADFDSDGHPDLLATTLKAGTHTSYRAEVLRVGATGVVSSWNADTGNGDQAAAWADFNNDGRIDFIHTGNRGGGETTATTLWKNNAVASNSSPSAPTALAVTVTDGMARLSWQPATDTETPSNSLSYNVRVGSTPGGSEVVSPLSAADGVRRIPALGNARYRHFLLLRIQPGQTYYWSVQAIDGGLRGGPFAAEQTFPIESPPRIVGARSLLSGGFFLRFTGTAGLSYRVEATDFITSPPSQTPWIILGAANEQADGFFSFVDDTNPQKPARFYRVLQDQ